MLQRRNKDRSKRRGSVNSGISLRHPIPKTSNETQVAPTQTTPDSYEASTCKSTPEPDSGAHDDSLQLQSDRTSTTDPNIDFLAPPLAIAELNTRLHKTSYRDLDTSWAGKKKAQSKANIVLVKSLSKTATDLRGAVSELASIADSPVWTTEERQEMHETMTEALKGLKETINHLAQVVHDHDEVRELDDMQRSCQAAAKSLGVDLGEIDRSTSESNA